MPTNFPNIRFQENLFLDSVIITDGHTRRNRCIYATLSCDRAKYENSPQRMHETNIDIISFWMFNIRSCKENATSVMTIKHVGS